MCGPDMAPTASACLSGPVLEYRLFVGTRKHAYTVATLNSTTCVFLLICLSFCTTHPTPTQLPSTPFIRWSNINEFHENKVIFLYLKTRCSKYYTLNTMYKKLHNLSCIRNLSKSTKIDTYKINNYTIKTIQ